MWLVSPALVFFFAAAMASVSFGLALLIPLDPRKGRETIFAAGRNIDAVEAKP